MTKLLRCARLLGLDLCPSLSREPGVSAGVLYYRPNDRASTRRQLARILAAHLIASAIL